MVCITGGLDEALNRITALSNEQTVPVVFALGRKALGRAVNKLVPVSVVGIFNYDGAQVSSNSKMGKHLHKCDSPFQNQYLSCQNSKTVFCFHQLVTEIPFNNELINKS